MKEIAYFVMLLLYMGASVGSILLISEIQRIYSFQFLKSLFYFELLMAIFGFYTLMGIKVLDIFGQYVEIAANIRQMISLIIVYIGIPFYVTAWYMFFKHLFELKDRTISLRPTYLYFTFFIILFFSYGLLNVYYIRSKQDFLFSTQKLYAAAFILIEFLLTFTVFILYYILDPRNTNSSRKGNIYINYLAILTAGHIISVVLLIFSVKASYTFPVFLLVFFIRDIPAFLYLRINIKEKASPNLENMANVNSFERFCERFNISRREKEILQLILVGKSNQEISEKLFITLQTVKDHNSRIYQKTDVRNRVQLLNLIAQS
jgi:DNA-binding CsgD family transcriptional regulator